MRTRLRVSGASALHALLRVACFACSLGLLLVSPAPAFARTGDTLIQDSPALETMSLEVSGNIRLASINDGRSDRHPPVQRNDDPKNRLGIYIPDGFDTAPEQAMAQETSFGRKISILSFYEAWGNGRRPDIAGIELCLRRGFVPMITWEPWRLPTGNQPPEKQPEYSLSALSSGQHDDYIRQWALDLKNLSAPIFLRIMHEMNGNWYPWCGKVNGNKPKDYIVAWRHIRSIFREVGCDKVIWVWSPYCESCPDESDNSFAKYFPGNEEVDCVALDGYNWGSTREWSRWKSFEEVFADGYARLTRLAAGKPFIIAEAGCAEEGGDKGLWIKSAVETLKKRFPAVKALVWFNINKECDWRIESSRESLISFRTNFSTW